MDLIPTLARRKGSAFAAAIEDDDDIAQVIVGMDAPTTSRPALFGWTHTRADLAEIKDLLILQLHRGSQSRPTLTPRPETGVERAKRHRMSVTHTAVLDKLLPGRH